MQTFTDEHMQLSELLRPYPRTIIPRSEFKQLLGYRYHRGIIGIGQRPAYGDLHQIEGRVLILNNVSGPENVGSFMRLAAAFGFQNVIFDSSTCTPFMRRCIRVSMGNVFHLTAIPTESLLASLRALKEKNYTVYCCERNDEATSLYKHKSFPVKAAFVFGGEGSGVADAILTEADQLIEVPQESHFTSLNVSHAGAIVMSYIHAAKAV